MFLPIHKSEASTPDCHSSSVASRNSRRWSGWSSSLSLELELLHSLSPGREFYLSPLVVIHLEVIAEVIIAEADSAVVTFPEDTVLPFFAEHPLVRRQRDIVATLLIICAPASTPREATRKEHHII